MTPVSRFQPGTALFEAHTSRSRDCATTVGGSRDLKAFGGITPLIRCDYVSRVRRSNRKR